MGLQLRLWLTVVVLVVAGALVLLLGTSALYERVMLPFETLSSQAMNATEGALVKHADETVDAATKASVDEAVRSAVKKAEMTPEAEAALLGRAGTQGAPTFALIVKPDGAIAGKAGQEAKLDGPLTGFPLFAEASTGLARDGVHVMDGKAFHLASAPVYDATGVLNGVVILGWPYDAAFADKLSTAVGAPVLVTVKNTRTGHALSAIADDQLKIRGSGVGELDLKPLPPQLPLLMEHGRYTLQSRPLTFGADDAVSVVVATDRNEAFKALAWAQAMVILGTLLITLLQVVLIASTLRGVSKPIALIVDHLSQVSQGNSVGVLPEAGLTGPFLRLGKQVNMILQMMPSASRPGSGSLGPLGAGSAPAINAPSLGGPSLGGLGTSPSMSGPMNGGLKETSGPALSFGLGNPDSTLDTRTPSKPLAPSQSSPSISAPNLGGGLGTGGGLGMSASSSGLSGAMPASPGGAQPPSGLSNLFDDGAPDPLAAFRVPPPQAKPAQAQARDLPPPARTQPSRPPEPEPEPEEPPSPMSPEATVMFQVPQELLNQSAQPSTSNLPQRPVMSHADDARTVVAQVPAELLSAGAPKDGISSADEAHYRDVYDKFVETRVQCGEDTSDLTYDRFVAKLLKNRQQIVEKHKAKSVRFQVYVKEGKAALRALPVRE